MADQMLPHYIMQTLPAGVSGLIISAIFAAAMSSIDSGINSMATVLINDLSRPFLGNANRDRVGVALARVLTVVLGVAATGIAFAIVRIGGIIKSFFTFMGLFSAPVLALFLLGMLTRRARFGGWVVGALTGISVTILLQRHGWMHEIHYFPLCFLINFAVGYIASLLFRGPVASRELTLSISLTRIFHGGLRINRQERLRDVFGSRTYGARASAAGVRRPEVGAHLPGYTAEA